MKIEQITCSERWPWTYHHDYVRGAMRGVNIPSRADIARVGLCDDYVAFLGYLQNVSLQESVDLFLHGDDELINFIREAQSAFDEQYGTISNYLELFKEQNGNNS